MPPAASARFPTTAWSCVREAQDPTHPKYAAAVNRLITAYWRPVFYFLRAKGHALPDAEDLTQEFFTRFLARGWLGRADPGRGRFRAFLKTLAGRYAGRRTRRPPRQGRFEQQFVAVSGLMDDNDRTWEPAAGETAEEVFDRLWRAETLATVRRNLRALYEASGDDRARQAFAIFAAYHLADRVKERPTRKELAARFGVTLDVVRAALDDRDDEGARNVRKRYERLLRQEYRDQVGSEEDIESELRGTG